MKAFRLLIYYFCFFLGSLGQLLADEKEDTLKMEEALKVISDPNVSGELKHQSMVVLQELKDPRSIEALYEAIDFVSDWGSQMQRSTQNSYPATRALVLIGEPSIEGAERYLKSQPSKNNTQLFLVSHVMYEIFRAKSGELNGSKFPKADAMSLEWQKENYSLAQLERLSENYYFPVIKEYLKTLPDSPVTSTAKINDNPGGQEEELVQLDFNEENHEESETASVVEDDENPLEILPKQNRLNIFWLVSGLGIVVILFFTFKTRMGKSSS